MTKLALASLLTLGVSACGADGTTTRTPSSKEVQDLINSQPDSGKADSSRGSGTPSSLNLARVVRYTACIGGRSYDVYCTVGWDRNGGYGTIKCDEPVYNGGACDCNGNTNASCLM